MSPPLTTPTEVYNYIDDQMMTFTFRAHEQQFLPRKVVDEVTQRNVIACIISKDGEIDLSSDERVKFVDDVHQRARKLFATCMYCEMPPNYLKYLLDRGLSDDDFPLSAEKDPIWSPKHPRPFIHHFVENQKRFNPIFFEPDSFQNLDDRRPIPIAFDEEESSLLGKGAFGEVWKVRIHEDQHSFDCDGDMFAMKVIQHNKSMEREKQFITDTRNLNHSHLMKCFATWKFGAKYHMLYELAEYNLEEFIKEMKDPNSYPGLNNAWLTKQMCGLAGALRAVHTQEEDDGHTDNDNKLGVPRELKPRSRGGYIHDIKPDNILVFRYEVSTYWFRLSDFSCAKVVDFVASISGQHMKSHLTASKTGTPDYRPPESMKEQTSRPYDLWSLGCVYLELFVWFLQGYAALEAFRADRRGFVRPNGVEDEAFYITDEVNLKLHLRSAVEDKISELSRICPSDLRPLLSVIPSLLQIDPKKRPTATYLVQQLGHLDTSSPFDFGRASPSNPSTPKALSVPTTTQMVLPQNNDSGSEPETNKFVVIHEPIEE